MDGNSVTAMAMVATALQQRAITPVEVAQYALDNGYRDPSGNTGVIPSFFTTGADYFEVVYEGQKYGGASLSDVKSFLESGDGENLAIVRVTADANNTYTAGATQLVIYKIIESGSLPFTGI